MRPLLLATELGSWKYQVETFRELSLDEESTALGLASGWKLVSDGKLHLERWRIRKSKGLRDLKSEERT
jgi:hypothetical protein